MSREQNDEIEVYQNHNDVYNPYSEVYERIYIYGPTSTLYSRRSNGTFYQIGPTGGAGVSSVTGYNVDNTNPLTPIILPLQVDGVTITGDGSLGNPLVAAGGGLASIPVGQAIFVDPTTGNDGTALPYRYDLMYATYDAAKAVAVPGDTIILYPGRYTVNNMQFDDGKVYAYPGVVLTGTTIVGDSGLTVGFTFSLLGFATIIASGYALNFSGSGNVNVEFDTCRTTGGAAIQYQKVADTVHIYGNHITGTNSTMYFFASNQTAKLYIDVKHIDNNSTNAFEMMIYIASGFAGDVNITSNLMTGAVKAGSIGGNMFCNQNSGSHTIKIYTDEMVDRAAAGFTTLLQGNGTDNLFISTKKYTGPGIVYSNGGDQFFEHHCEQANVLESVATIVSTYNILLEGSYVSASAVATGVIYNNTARIRLKNFDLKVTGVAPAYEHIAGTLIVDEATMVTAGGVAAGFTAAAPATIIVNGRATTNGPIVNITNLVVGTLLLSEPNISL